MTKKKSMHQDRFYSIERFMLGDQGLLYRVLCVLGANRVYYLYFASLMKDLLFGEEVERILGSFVLLDVE